MGAKAFIPKDPAELERAIKKAKKIKGPSVIIWDKGW
jgi:pyruvate/2-oxoacid:ferredoxin oxidoreductase beta subunit